MVTEPWNLEPLRRSMVLGGKDLPSGLTNGDAAEVIGFALQLEQRVRLLEAGIAELLERNSPVPRANAQLRRMCVDLSRLLAQSSQRPTASEQG